MSKGQSQFVVSDPSPHVSEPRQDRGAAPPLPVGSQLVRDGRITPYQLEQALGQQREVEALLGDILIAERAVAPEDMLDAVARQHHATRVRLNVPLSQDLASLVPVDICLANKVVPYKRFGNQVLMATSRPDKFEAFRKAMPDSNLEFLPVVASLSEIRKGIGELHGKTLCQRAVTKVPEAESCRTFARRQSRVATILGCIAALIIAAACLAPSWTITALIGLVTTAMVMTIAIKALAFSTQIVRGVAQPSAPAGPPPKNTKWPKVSVLVPLFEEEQIADVLVRRLSRLTYPKSLLDVILVLEGDDAVTRATLEKSTLPPWMSVIEVPPDGTLKTKPRAMNYALDFCEGTIIGVWDAEDAPAPDQLQKVVTRFAEAPAEVACLQGILDYYNSRENWIARCFTIEYATWWRVILPGMARLGLVVPLGGTTLFFKREVLEELNAWDAHNVTEDADLGLRLARRGYRTELVPTVTLEEANCWPWRWIRQRSRWIKGFLITYLVHMRRPGQLFRDLGAWRFLGVQTLFLAGFLQVLLAPLFWSFWICLAGYEHPIEATLSVGAVQALLLTFLVAECLNMAMGLLATSTRTHRHLIPFVFMMPIYFLLSSAAAIKALYELLSRPFFWDKTQHGESKSTLLT